MAQGYSFMRTLLLVVAFYGLLKADHLVLSDTSVGPSRWIFPGNEVIAILFLHVSKLSQT